MTSHDIDDADVFLEIVDSWLEAWIRLSDARALLPMLMQVQPPSSMWEQVIAAISRAATLIQRFDALGEEVFMAENSARRKLMLDIGGTLRIELVEKLTACQIEWNAAVEEWKDSA